MKSGAFYIGPSLREGGVELGGFAYPALWDPTSLQLHMVVKAQTLLVQLNAVHICCDKPATYRINLSDHNYWQAKGLIFWTVYPVGAIEMEFSRNYWLRMYS